MAPTLNVLIFSISVEISNGKEKDLNQRRFFPKVCHAPNMYKTENFTHKIQLTTFISRDMFLQRFLDIFW